MTVWQMIGVIGGALLTLISLLGMVYRALRKVNMSISAFAEGLMSLLRSDIMSIYYRHCDEEEPTLREYERKNLDALFSAYEKAGGNSFVADLYNDQMRHWHVTR